jgi:predicted acylesterase/phospholipase RssA/CRP-like cAMP-binding protein
MDYLDFITSLPFFSKLHRETIQALASSLEEKNLSSGEVLVNQGDSGQTFYLVASGKLTATSRCAKCGDTSTKDLGPGDYLGEMTLLRGQNYGAIVAAAEDSSILCLHKASFEQLLEIHPELIQAWADELLAHFRQAQSSLALTRVFGELDENILASLQQKLEWHHLDSGDVLFRQGEPGNEMYVVIQGRVRFAVEDGSGASRDLGEIGAGECVGEFSLLTESGAPESLRSATVYATRQTDLISISRETFEELLEQQPRIVLKLTRRIIHRELHVAQSPVPEMSARVIAVVPLHPHLAMNDFSRELAAALEQQGSTFLLDAASFDDLYGKTGSSQTPLDHPESLLINTWLDEREQEHQFAIYNTQPVLNTSGQLGPWAQRCVEDADLILLVGDSQAYPVINAVDAALSGVKTRARVELVLLHADTERVPSGTASWLGPRSHGNLRVSAHHHIRQRNSSDFHRLGRRISGRTVGLTLGGGGARGWAHIGALRAIEEADLEIDWVGGASMGAIIAAGCALDWTSSQLQGLAERFSDPKKLLDYTLPYASITATRHITNLLQELYGNATIEDTWRPYFCISANLTRGQEQTHTSGPLWKAVRASMAFPGVFAPVFDDGCVLIDGGAANNLPIDRMREFCPTGTVIGVDLLTSSPTSGFYDFGPSLSGWDVLAGRFNPFAKKVIAPNLVDIIGGVVYSNDRYRLNEIRGSANLLIEIPVEQYGLLEFDKYLEIIEAGYVAARQQIGVYLAKS